MKNKTLTYLFLCILLCQSLWAQQKNELIFIENVGQIHDQQGKARKDIDYILCASNGLNIFIGKGKISYQFADDKNLQRMEAQLKGANTTALRNGEEKQGYYENHYFASKLVGVAHSYKKIVYHNVYPHIDWVLKINANNTFEYEFAVGALGNAAQIAIEYKGASNINLDPQGNLIVATALGTTKEHAPETYTATGVKINSAYLLQGNTLSFHTDPYQGALVIDPKVAWATYYGDVLTSSFLVTYTKKVLCNKKGEVYFVGSTNATNYIATAGAYQTTLKAASGSKVDIFYAKFDSSGKRLYATYFGAAKPLAGAYLELNGDTVYLTGGGDVTNTLATPGAERTSFAPHKASNFLVKFDPSGALLWCTYCAGYRASCDKENNIYVSGGVDTSYSDVATPGAFRTTFVDTFDAVLSKYNSKGKRIWGTYYGGIGNDGFSAITYMENDGNGAIYVLGQTSSDTGIATPGAYQTSRGGKINLMLVKFDTSGKRIWGTYIGGNDIDAAQEISQDGFKNVYITGITSSTTGIASAGAYQPVIGGLRDLFLLKFNSLGSRMWGTYFGGNKDEAGYGVCNDKEGNVYLCGRTESLSKIADSAAFQSKYGGGYSDGLIAAFKPNGKKLWSSYYGGEAADDLKSVSFDGVNLYLVGITNSTSGVATKGSFLDSNTNKNEQAFLLKIGEPKIGYGTDTTTSIIILDFNKTFKIYPNPNKGVFNFEVKINAFQNASLSILDVAGNKVWLQSIVAATDGQINQQINIRQLQAGVYFLRCQTDEFDKTISFLKD